MLLDYPVVKLDYERVCTLYLTRIELQYWSQDSCRIGRVTMDKSEYADADTDKKSAPTYPLHVYCAVFYR